MFNESIVTAGKWLYSTFIDRGYSADWCKGLVLGATDSIIASDDPVKYAQDLFIRISTASPDILDGPGNIDLSSLLKLHGTATVVNEDVKIDENEVILRFGEDSIGINAWDTRQGRPGDRLFIQQDNQLIYECKIFDIQNGPHYKV